VIKEQTYGACLPWFDSRSPSYPFRPKVLHAQPQSIPEVVDDDDRSSCHPDERQIKLDTERSFVLYPVGETCA
jgi:hypothetical protein